MRGTGLGRSYPGDEKEDCEDQRNKFAHDRTLSAPRPATQGSSEDSCTWGRWHAGGVDRLSRAQQDLWDEADPDGVVPSGDQDLAAAENMAVDGFRAACRFEGLDDPMPSEEAIRAAIRESRR